MTFSSRGCRGDSVLETVWSEPGSPVTEQPPLPPPTATTAAAASTALSKLSPDHRNANCHSKKIQKPQTLSTRTRNNNINNNNNCKEGQKSSQNNGYYEDALEALLRGWSEVDNGDPDQLFLLPDRVLTVDSLTFREELAAVAPAFLSPVTPTATPVATTPGVGFGKLNNNNGPPHSSLDSTDSNRSVRLADDTEGLIITHQGLINGCLWLCELNLLQFFKW